jgi:hypothetical protein
MDRILNLELETLSALRMADAALAVARYKLKHQYWPKDLQDCVPDYLPLVPADPFNPTESLRFAIEPARIYGLGISPGYHPYSHGTYPFESRLLMNQLFERDNLVLFLGNPAYFRSLPDDVEELPGVDIPSEIKNLSSANADDRHAALRRLETVGVKAVVGVDALLERLKNGDVEERIYAAYILGRSGVSAETVRLPLLTASTDADSFVRVFARQALRRLER